MSAQIDGLFRLMCEAGASDLHLMVGTPPLVRKDGGMKPLDPAAPVLDAETGRPAARPDHPGEEQGRSSPRSTTPTSRTRSRGSARFRANIFMDRKGKGAVFRVIPSKILTAEQLGLSPAILNLCKLHKGLVLVTGPTGSGKSTTLCAMIDHINKTRNDHIITIEDPIEFVHENKQCAINQREVHNHTDSFKAALRAALREDPTSSWSASCAIWRPWRSRSRRRRPATSCSARCTRRRRRRRSTASSISSRPTARRRSA